MRLHWNDATLTGLDTAALERAVAGLGVVAGHRIGLLTGNSPATILLHKAARRPRWTLVPLDPRSPPEWLARQAAGCHAFVATKRLRSLALELRTSRPLLACDSWGQPDRADPGPIAPPSPPPEGPPAFLVQTSGTSGVPRPVPITWSMLDAHAAAATRRISDSSDAVWACVVGLDRIAGIAMAERFLRHGSTLWLEERFDAERLAALLRHRGITHVSLVPTMLQRLLEVWGDARPPPSLRCVLLGGDRAPEPLVQSAFARGWPLWCTYGLTEACSQVATARPEERRAKPGTSGRLLDGVRAEVRDGEIFLSGPTIAGGGPLATGDVGWLDADGFLFVAGRKDDRITTGGVKVDPAVIEDVLRMHPAVADACVVGLPDAEWGSRVVAAVVLREGADASDLKLFCAARLPAPYVPKDFTPVDAVPRTESGKLRRAEVRAALQATVPT